MRTHFVKEDWRKKLWKNVARIILKPREYTEKYLRLEEVSNFTRS